MFALLQDRAGNTLALIAAALFPMLALLGGGIDMGRSYLAQSRLQQACDSGVLAARKKLGSAVVADGNIPAGVADTGTRFFNLNFRDGSYGTRGRAFSMTLEKDYAISGAASVDVPTTIMTIFGYSQVPIAVNCEARLNFSNTDIMFVLDTTGSMADTNPGDTQPKINVLRSVVQSFYNQMEASKTAGTRIRYGFVPYSTNVNVGGLLDPSWMVSRWKYQSREQVVTGYTDSTRSYVANWATESGTRSDWTTQSSYAATFHAGSTTTNSNEQVVTTADRYTCDGSQPGNTLVESGKTLVSSSTAPFAGPPTGTQTTDHYRTTYNGDQYRTILSGQTCLVQKSTASAYTVTYDWITEPTRTQNRAWHYNQFNRDVSNWANEYNGCIEERDTYEITDYANVDLGKALDLDIDLVPTSDPKTQWRPMYPAWIYGRALKWDGSGGFNTSPVTTTDEYIAPGAMGTAACPAAARKLGSITSAELSSYLGGLSPNGATYHDIGMIWGGRLLSPTGLFAGENADVDGKPTSRNMIFLTDGLTAPLDVSYSSYGIEPLDRRRWSPGSAETLTGTVEKRFAVACAEVKKRNITVWVIGFGTSLNPILTNCAGPGHYFEASNAAELSSTFSKIAEQLGDLRISK